eukprot:TRINITY_DN7296_c0_g1_i1.p1 TRINITY_DN7296_c0_g1~~TRINITY_DN7296_c0_g1_i1.p1  ORF type:complete len:702 (-),score=153.86 TRINITY_DN7296_c0_g1_i1:230-2335(-)
MLLRALRSKNPSKRRIRTRPQSYGIPVVPNLRSCRYYCEIENDTDAENNKNKTHTRYDRFKSFLKDAHPKLAKEDRKFSSKLKETYFFATNYKKAKRVEDTLDRYIKRGDAIDKLFESSKRYYDEVRFGIKKFPASLESDMEILDENAEVDCEEEEFLNSYILVDPKLKVDQSLNYNVKQIETPQLSYPLDSVVLNDQVWVFNLKDSIFQILNTENDTWSEKPIPSGLIIDNFDRFYIQGIKVDDNHILVLSRSKTDSGYNYKLVLTDTDFETMQDIPIPNYDISDMKLIAFRRNILFMKRNKLNHPSPIKGAQTAMYNPTQVGYWVPYTEFYCFDWDSKSWKIVDTKGGFGLPACEVACVDDDKGRMYLHSEFGMFTLDESDWTLKPHLNLIGRPQLDNNSSSICVDNQLFIYAKDYDIFARRKSRLVPNDDDAIKYSRHYHDIYYKEYNKKLKNYFKDTTQFDMTESMFAGPVRKHFQNRDPISHQLGFAEEVIDKEIDEKIFKSDVLDRLHNGDKSVYNEIVPDYAKDAKGGPLFSPSREYIPKAEEDTNVESLSNVFKKLNDRWNKNKDKDIKKTELDKTVEKVYKETQVGGRVAEEDMEKKIEEEIQRKLEEKWEEESKEESKEENQRKNDKEDSKLEADMHGFDEPNSGFLTGFKKRNVQKPKAIELFKLPNLSEAVQTLDLVCISMFALTKILE